MLVSGKVNFSFTSRRLYGNRCSDKRYQRYIFIMWKTVRRQHTTYRVLNEIANVTYIVLKELTKAYAFSSQGLGLAGGLAGRLRAIGMEARGRKPRCTPPHDDAKLVLRGWPWMEPAGQKPRLPERLLWTRLCAGGNK